MNELSDEQIVNSVLNGDTEAFSELITRYNNRVFAVGMRLLEIRMTPVILLRRFSSAHSI